MLNDENKDLCWRVLSKYGCQGQMMMVIEECSELQKAVCKINRDDGHITAQHDANFREELIDTIVMCQQMVLMLKMDMNEINRKAHEKLLKALGVEQ